MAPNVQGNILVASNCTFKRIYNMQFSFFVYFFVCVTVCNMAKQNYCNNKKIIHKSSHRHSACIDFLNNSSLQKWLQNIPESVIKKIYIVVFLVTTTMPSSFCEANSALLSNFGGKNPWSINILLCILWSNENFTPQNYRALQTLS